MGVVQRFTEVRIRQLCKDVVSAKSQQEEERILRDLRGVLDQHVPRAAEAPERRVITFPSASKKN